MERHFGRTMARFACWGERGMGLRRFTALEMVGSHTVNDETWGGGPGRGYGRVSWNGSRQHASVGGRTRQASIRFPPACPVGQIGGDWLG